MIEVRSIRKMDGKESRFKVVYLNWLSCGCSYSRHVLIFYQETEPTREEIDKRIADDNNIQG